MEFTLTEEFIDGWKLAIKMMIENRIVDWKKREIAISYMETPDNIIKELKRKSNDRRK